MSCRCSAERRRRRRWRRNGAGPRTTRQRADWSDGPHLAGSLQRSADCPFTCSTFSLSLLVFENDVMKLPTFPRLHWCGEGRHRVYSQSRAALHLSDHLCGPTALDHHVRPHRNTVPSPRSVAVRAAEGHFTVRPNAEQRDLSETPVACTPTQPPS